MKLKSYTFSQKLLKTFLNYNIHIGLTKSSLKNDYYYYLHGFRNKTSIIKICYTLINFKKLFYFIKWLLKNNKKIIFVGFPIWFNKKWKLLENYSNKRYLFLEYSWKNKSNQILNINNKIGLIVIGNNYDKKKEFLKEVKYLSVPVAGFTVETLDFFDFPITGHFKSKRSICLFYYFLLNLLKKDKNSKKIKNV